MASSLPYHEPPPETILKQSAFLLALNCVNHVLDAALYCGLVGQIAIGIAWGSPGGKLLSHSAQEVIVQLGYIGLLLLVYEGGLSTSFSAFKANLFLSSAVAVTGIAVPIGLSYILMQMASATPLEAFAAGAALCSTSLGTTFTLLSSSGLSSTRLGVVLTTAAMMDDVVGLIMVQVITNLGSASGFSATTVIRPVFVSLAFALLLPIACRYIVLPCTRLLNAYREKNPAAMVSTLLRRKESVLVSNSIVLVGMVAGAVYAGTSGLLGAYIAGAMVSWWDSEAPHVKHEEDSAPDCQSANGSIEMSDRASADQHPAPLPEDAPERPPEPRYTGANAFEVYYSPVLQRLLKPFFFASIGFSIPIAKMFEGPIVWRGIIYAILMAIGKLFCGAWLIRIPNPMETPFRVLTSMHKRWFKSSRRSEPTARPDRRASRSTPAQSSSRKPAKPLSIYPGLLLGCAMTARGEVGYLISSLAEANGVFGSSDGPSDLFLITTWAITLCTVVGPLCMGLLVKRLRLKDASSKGQGERVLGVWGI